MDKRIIVAAGLCFVVMIVWTKLFPVQRPAAAHAAQSVPAAATQAKAPPRRPCRPRPSGGAGHQPARAVGRDRHAGRQVRLLQPGRNAGARPAAEREVRRPAGRSVERPRPGGARRIRRRPPCGPPSRTPAFPPPPTAPGRCGAPIRGRSSFATDTGSAHIEKRYTVDTTRYRLQLDVSIANRSAQPIDQHLTIALAGRQDPEKRGGGFFAGLVGQHRLRALYVDDDKVERKAIDKLGKDPVDKLGAVKWIGTDEKFFLLAAVPYPESPPRERRCASSPLADGAGEVTLSFAERTVPRARERRLRLRRLRRPEGDRRPRGGSSRRRGGAARQGRRRDAWRFSRAPSSRCSSSSTASPTTGGWRSSC